MGDASSHRFRRAVETSRREAHELQVGRFTSKGHGILGHAGMVDRSGIARVNSDERVAVAERCTSVHDAVLYRRSTLCTIHTLPGRHDVPVVIFAAMNPIRLSVRTLAVAWLATAALATTGGAQARGRVEGVVIEPTTGLPVPSVEVRLLGTPHVMRTDTLGAFALTLDAGRYFVRATRLGFGPRSVAMEIAGGDTVTMSIEMDVLPIQLNEVIVRAREERYRGKLAGFAERMRTSAAPRSSFITRDEIERKAPRFTSDLLRDRAGRMGACYSSAAIWLDGSMLVPDKIGSPIRGRRTEPLQRDLRLDHIPPDQIEAMEVYAGSAQTPAEFSATAMPGLEPGCTIVIWTR